MNTQYCVIQTTAGSKTEADKFAQLLVRERLAACIQVMPITSYYWLECWLPRGWFEQPDRTASAAASVWGIGY
jgi:hypothetical protein